MKEVTIKYEDTIEHDKPSLNLLISHKNCSWKFSCILDSGADMITLPMRNTKNLYGIDLTDATDAHLKRLADMLNVTQKDTECFCNHPLKSIILPAKLQILGLEYPEILVYVNWVKSNNGQDVKPVIGRDPFFRYFDITISEHNKSFTLKPNIEVFNDKNIEIPNSFYTLVGGVLTK